MQVKLQDLPVVSEGVMAAAMVARKSKSQSRIQHVESHNQCLQFLPDQEGWIHSGVLDKLVGGAELEEWKPRQFVLTSDKLLVARENNNIVIDHIPLDEIIFIRAVIEGASDESSGGKNRKKKKIIMDSVSTMEALVDGDELGKSHNCARLEIKTSDEGFNGGRT